MQGKEDLDQFFLATTTRHQRYRLAEKAFRYYVYQGIEIMVAILFFLMVIAVWIDASDGIVIGVAMLVGSLSLIHYASAALQKPWLLMAAVFESVAVWFIYEQWLTDIFQIPFFSAFCVFVFTLRFWQRGEREVQESALMNLRAMNRFNKPMDPTGR